MEFVLPRPVGERIVTDGYRNTPGDSEISCSGVTLADYENYLNALIGAGCAFYDTNTMAENRFATLVRGGLQLNLAYYPQKSLLKAVLTKKEYLPPKNPPVFVPTVEPSLTQLARTGAEQLAPGMSYVLQLADGSFLLIDGGPSDEKDTESLFSFLSAHKPPPHKRPRIAAWFITHAHSDHIDLALDFLRRYHGEVELGMVAFRFPDFPNITIEHEDVSLLRSRAEDFRAITAKFYPNAAVFSFHTGQRLFLPGAEVEILYTCDDFFPEPFPWGNHTSCAFRIRLGKTSFLATGDCEKKLCLFMAEVYGKTLKSDIMQLSHHGFNCGCMELYEKVDPDICLWPVDAERHATDPRCLGIRKGFEFNAFLRDDTQKKRKHYHSSQTVTIPTGSVDL